MTILHALYRDEAGFVVSAELVMIATITVLSLIVGLVEIQTGVDQELEDVGSAIGGINQSFHYGGLRSCEKSSTSGSRFEDGQDDCDDDCDLVRSKPREEQGHESHGGGKEH
jgi:Flp pilus assembly pilin Flp